MRLDPRRATARTLRALAACAVTRAARETVAVDLALLVLPPLLAVLLLRDAIRTWRPTRALIRGRYAEARAASEALAKSWLRVFPSVRNAARYGVAASFHMQGNFAASLAALRAIDRASLDRNLDYATASLEAANLVLDGTDPARAVTLLERVRAIHEPPEDLLLLAHAKHALGDAAAAQELLERAGSTRGSPRVRLGRTLLFEPRAHQIAMFHALRALLCIKLGRTDEAASDLARAAAAPLSNWYTERARALLPPRGGDGDPRSSLAPQVLE